MFATLLNWLMPCLWGTFFGPLYIGDSGNRTAGATTNVSNADRRNAVQDGVGVSGDHSSVSLSSTYESTSNSDSHAVYVDNSNSSDAIKALASAGADIIKSSGASVVDLARFQGEQNTDAWNTTITAGAGLVDKLIDKVGDGFKLSSQAISNFTPTENKNSEVVKYAAIAAAVAVVGLVWSKK